MRTDGLARAWFRVAVVHFDLPAVVALQSGLQYLYHVHRRFLEQDHLLDDAHVPYFRKGDVRVVGFLGAWHASLKTCDSTKF